MLVAVSLIVISLSVLFYKHPPSTWSFVTRILNHRAPPGTASTTPQTGDTQRTLLEERKEELPNAADDSASSSPSIPSPQLTPKALPRDRTNVAPIPTFTLAEHDSPDEDEGDDHLPPPSFPAANSAQRASAALAFSSMPPPAPLKPTGMAPPPQPPSLMPPPRINPSNLRALPTAAPSLRVPTTGPLPNRGPVPNRGPAAPGESLAPTVKTPNARGKTLLSPGHSPLDWANLQRSGENLSGVSSLIRVTPSMLKENNGRKGKPAWSLYQGKVYNITPYLPFHPGGEGELRRAAGKDGGKLFMEVHPWVNWDNMLGECVVGIMVAEEPATSSLEDMD